jgi:hypothetical protein
MTNVYFGSNGLTSTEANYLANIAKELQNAAFERLNNIKFLNVSISAINSYEKQLMKIGNNNLEFIPDDLKILAETNSFCAWIREAIKEKEAQIEKINETSLESWAEMMDIKIPIKPNYPRDPKTPTEKDIIDSWDINKRNKYLTLEAFAATLGKYIHPEGVYNKERKNTHQAINTPIIKEGNGRDIILYYYETSIDINLIDDMFIKLQEKYREYEQELNQMKAEIKDIVNKRSIEAYDLFLKECDEHKKQLQNVNIEYDTLRTQFNCWKNKELERISKYKIIIPDSLKEIFNKIKETISKK